MPVRTQIQIARKLKVNIISQNSPNSHLFSGQTNQIMQPLHCKKIRPKPCASCAVPCDGRGTATLPCAGTVQPPGLPNPNPNPSSLLPKAPSVWIVWMSLTWPRSFRGPAIQRHSGFAAPAIGGPSRTMPDQASGIGNLSSPADQWLDLPRTMYWRWSFAQPVRLGGSTSSSMRSGCLWHSGIECLSESDPMWLFFVGLLCGTWNWKFYWARISHSARVAEWLLWFPVLHCSSTPYSKPELEPGWFISSERGCHDGRGLLPCSLSAARTKSWQSHRVTSWPQ